ncbi:MAG: MmcQ/YjbR family DNA-binding protein [Acidimicrobiia bacterium]|nr:MmcQ/YjbR family DNA-binding protein [Acidimicrobiia bacterium]
MKAEELLDYCLGLPGAWEDEPWEGDVTAKVHDKIFAFFGERSVGLKCGATREEADRWLAHYPDDATVMSYIGRYGWNTLRLDGSIPPDVILQAVDDSYLSIVGKLAKTRRPKGWEIVGG